MKYQEVENVLNQMGLKEVSRTDKAIGFSDKDGPAVIYINAETRTERNTLILHPQYEHMLAKLIQISGVSQGRSNFRFGNDYASFPSRGMAVGGTSHYGLSFCFENDTAVASLLKTTGLVA